jgi:hypothetical protein
VSQWLLRHESRAFGEVTREYVKLIQDAFDPYNMATSTIRVAADKDLAELQEKANTLTSILQARLLVHIRNRVKDSSKHNHYVWQLATSNIGRVAAAMIIFGHVRNDLTALKFDECACLLASSSKNTFVKAVTPDVLSMEGCYLMLDTESGDFVRSGKVVGKDRSFDHRHKEHSKRALVQGTEDLESLFYRSYPSKNAPVSAVEGVRRGYFEDLELCCGLGL